MSESLYTLFIPPEGYKGDFGLICGFTATEDTLVEIKRRFSTVVDRPVLAAFIHPTAKAVSTIPGLLWMWPTKQQPPYQLLHAKVALLGFEEKKGAGYCIRLVVTTGNWTSDPLTTSIDMYWSTELTTTAAPDLQIVADIRAAWAMFEWLSEFYDTSLLEERFYGRVPDQGLRDAIRQLPPSTYKPRFIDSRNTSLFRQVVNQIAIKGKYDSLIIGSGYYEQDQPKQKSVPELLKEQLVSRTNLSPDACFRIVVNPDSCQGLASRASALLDDGWEIYAPKSPFLNQGGKLHAKFIAYSNTKKNKEIVGKIYIGSGNLSKQGFLMSARQGGNLEAGVVDEMNGLYWDGRNSNCIFRYLPIDINRHVEASALSVGSDFENPEPAPPAPEISWLIWNHGVLAAPDNQHIDVMWESQRLTTPCDWPGEAPRLVTLADSGWIIPVMTDGALVKPMPRDMTVEDILAGLSLFPDHEDDDAESTMTAADREPPLQNVNAAPIGAAPQEEQVYPLRRMMMLLVRLTEVQANLDPREWDRWCVELKRNLIALAGPEEPMISFFRQAGVNPLSVLMDEGMIPRGVDAEAIRSTVDAVSVNWDIATLPSLWQREVA